MISYRNIAKGSGHREWAGAVGFGGRRDEGVKAKQPIDHSA